jgi:hypothetical protein
MAFESLGIPSLTPFNHSNTRLVQYIFSLSVYSKDLKTTNPNMYCSENQKSKYCSENQKSKYCSENQKSKYVLL